MASATFFVTVIREEQECRALYRKAVTAARNSGCNPPPVCREPVLPTGPDQRAERQVQSVNSALGMCLEALTTVIKMTQGKLHLSGIQKELSTILNILEASHYKSVFNLKDDVLLIWRTSLRFCNCFCFALRRLPTMLTSNLPS